MVEYCCEVMIVFAANLREARKSKGLTQGELAKMAGLALETISRWERGERKPRAYDVEKVAQQLGVTAASLLGTDIVDDLPEDVAAPLEMMIAARLKAARKKLFSTEQELADVMSVPRRAVINWETGRVQPTTEMIIRLAAILDVSVAYLLGESDAANVFEFESAPYSAIRDRARREAPMMTPDQREEVIYIMRKAIAEMERADLPNDSHDADLQFADMDYGQLVDEIEKIRREIEVIDGYPGNRTMPWVRAASDESIKEKKEQLRRVSMELDKRNKRRLLSDV